MSRQRTMDTILSSEFVSIGELVRITGCRYSTLKFYTEQGMLPFEQAEENLTRRYRREKTVARIERIKKLKSNNLTIPQIQDVLAAEG